MPLRTRTTGPGTNFNSRLHLTSYTLRNCRVLLWAEKLGAGLWAGLLSCYCQLELEVTVTITDSDVSGQLVAESECQ
jgi:hypothetical protein